MSKVNKRIEAKECGFNSKVCDGCGERKNNWYTCMWGSLQHDMYSDIEASGDKIPVYPE